MKIAEMKNCIEKMREIYKFDDEKTEIRIDRLAKEYENMVDIYTEDENGTQIRLTRVIDESVEIK